MAGMFGPPGGMAMPGMGAPKKRTPSAREKTASGDTTSPTSPQVQPQQAPIVPIPGMQRVQSPPTLEKEDEPEDKAISRARAPDVIPDLEDLTRGPLPRTSTTEERGAPPPISKGKIARKPLLHQRRRSPLRSGGTLHVKTHSICSNSYDGTVCLVDTVAIISLISRSKLIRQTYSHTYHRSLPCQEAC